MDSSARRWGLVVMAYGTPRTPDDIEAYYTHIRRGQPPTSELLADLTARYEAIGGISPLAERTEAQRQALEHALERRTPGRWQVVLGQKHAAPFVEDAVGELARAGVTDAIGLVLAPHYSHTSVGEYQRRASEAGASLGVTIHPIDHWHLEPAYLAFLADAVRDARARLPENHIVLFSAHSLPERALVADPYPDELHESAAAVAERLVLADTDWTLCWQSAGRTSEAWRGPDILDVIRDIGATRRAHGVLVCAQGFTSDHLEVLYDIDIDAARVAAAAGVVLARARSLNDDPTVMTALADLVIARAGTTEGL